MRLRLLLIIACTLALGACSNMDEGVGHVTAITLEPDHPAAGVRTRVLVDLYDPYMYPSVEGAGPRVTLQVDGGEVEGQDWNNTLGNWEQQHGPSIFVYPNAAMYWTLPSEPGTYKLTIGFDGSVRTKQVEIH